MEMYGNGIEQRQSKILSNLYLCQSHAVCSAIDFIYIMVKYAHSFVVLCVL